MKFGTILVFGVALGTAYTVSPIAILFALAVIPLYAWALSGIDGDERRWLFAVLMLALIVRLIAASVLVLATNPATQQFQAFAPDARFGVARSWWIRNQWLGVEIGPPYRLILYNPYGRTSYGYVLASIQLLVGQSPYGVNFVAMFSFLAAAIALYRVARTSYGSLTAWVGLSVLVLWPPFVIWSVSSLREAFQLGLTAAVIVGVVHALRGRSWRQRVAGAALVVAGLAAVSTIRAGALLIVAGGIAIAFAGRVVFSRPSLARLAVAVTALASLWAITQRPVQHRLLAFAQQAVRRHVGEVATTGNSYKTLEYRFYVDPLPEVIETLTFGEAVDFTIRSVAAFFVVPLPWQLSSTIQFVFFPIQVCWLALVGCAVVGIRVGHMRDPLLTWLFLGYLVASVAVIAPNSANIGTLVRHRDIVMPSIAWLAAVGVCGVVAWQGDRWRRAFA
ncbi:MAG TPA: hypothetical protein VFA59_25195 [Vicinamibacterales bacterium]|nr:hypothetical protein [Vicinamibacterales bacterium]